MKIPRAYAGVTFGTTLLTGNYLVYQQAEEQYRH